MSSKSISRLFASAALCIAVPLSFAQTPGTAGPANPKEVGKPGTAANSGTGTSGAANSSDAKGANAREDGASNAQKGMDKAKQNRAAKKAATSASAP